jgi:hypothetical protein
MPYLMGLRHMLGHCSTHIVRDVGHVCQEALRHTEQGLMGPTMEPIKLGAVDQSRELACTDAELVADRAEAQHHMQVAADLQTRTPHTCHLCICKEEPAGTAQLLAITLQRKKTSCTE